MSESNYIQTNGIQLHCLKYEGDGIPIILMHGLTANAHSFVSILKNGISHPVYSVDLRGRGDSDKPTKGYTIHDHAADILGLMDTLSIPSAILGGHSFGALLSLYLAYHHPEKVEKLILIDAAARMHPNTKEMIAPSMSRLTKEWANKHEYFNTIRKAPYLSGLWDDDIQNYYNADIEVMTSGVIRTKSNLENITEAVNDIFDIGLNWLNFIKGIQHPAILINGTDVYSLDAAILPEHLAMETVHMMKNCRYIHVSGNHLTMLFAQGAKEIASSINSFIRA